MLFAEMEVWEWDKANEEELGWPVFNTLVGGGAGSWCIPGRQSVQTLGK